MCSCTRTRTHTRACTHTPESGRALGRPYLGPAGNESGKLQAPPLARNPGFVAVHSREPRAGWGLASEEQIWLQVSRAVEGLLWWLMSQALEGSGQAPGTQGVCQGPEWPYSTLVLVLESWATLRTLSHEGASEVTWPSGPQAGQLPVAG